MTRRFVIAAILVTWAGSAQANPVRRVVELFTSQGCSSCPPADKLAAELAQDPASIVVSLPVDYWDYLGWKDTLALRAFTARQKAYSEVRGDRQVYTPQAVVSGANHAIGSDRGAIEVAAETAKGRDALTVPVSVEDTGTVIRIQIGEGARPVQPVTVVLMPVRKRCDVSIQRGENKGKAVSYTNVVREVISVGMWSGSAKTLEVPSAMVRMRDGDAFIVLVQGGTPERPGVILGAAKGPGL